MPLIAAGVMGAGQLLGGVMAQKTAKDAQKQQAAFINKAIAELEKVGIPSVEAQKIALETPELVFDYAPQLEQQFPEIKSQFEQIAIDPRLQEAQYKALSGLQERAEEGLTAEEKAQIDALRRSASGQGAAQRASAVQEMERRGLGGSGAELLSQLSASQNAQQMAAQGGQELAALQAQAKQAALQNLATISGSIREQEFGEQAKQASASDIIAQFNRQQQAGTQQRNIGAQNEAELMRQKALQAQEEGRVAAANQEQMYNKQLLQQQYQNQLEKAKAAGSAYTGAGQAAAQAGAQQAANTQQTIGGISQALAGGIKAYNNSGTSSSPTIQKSSGGWWDSED